MDTQTLQLDTAPGHDAVVIWLHGLGADAADFPPAVPYLKLPPELGIRFLFPNAKEQPVTINGGWVMRSWYDILSMDLERELDTRQLAESVSHIADLAGQSIAAGIAPERILLVGFSQGGAVAYETGLTHSPQLGGVAAMSTYLPRPVEELQPSVSASFPLLVLHGLADDVVPAALGSKAVTQLEQAGFRPEWRTFEMAHEVSQASLETLGRWITHQLIQPGGSHADTK